MADKAQELSINFLVVFILAIVIFALGVLLVWKIFFSGTETIGIGQAEFDRRIGAMNCRPSDTVCIGVNSVQTSPGESILFDVKIYNNFNLDLDYDIVANLFDSQDRRVPVDNEIYTVLPNQYLSQTVKAKNEGEYSFLLKTTKRFSRGQYALKIQVNPEDLDPITRRIIIDVE